MQAITELKALPDQKVQVLNYRKRPSQWEAGRVNRLTTYWGAKGEPHNAYEVLLDRRSPNGFPITVTVGDTGIRKEG